MNAYDTDLAWVHHVGYARHAEATSRGIVALLEAAGIGAGAQVLDIGCGSGVLARRLVHAGYSVVGVDASPAMVALARHHAPAATFDVLALPASASMRTLPEADAVVSTGHVLNYLESHDDIAHALRELAAATRAGGMLAIDLATDAFVEARADGEVHAKVDDDWAIVVRFERPARDRLDRRITVFRRDADRWRRSDEHHRNVSFDVGDALRILRDCGVDAALRPSFGDETLPRGLVVIAGVRRR